MVFGLWALACSASDDGQSGGATDASGELGGQAGAGGVADAKSDDATPESESSVGGAAGVPQDAQSEAEAATPDAGLKDAGADADATTIADAKVDGPKCVTVAERFAACAAKFDTSNVSQLWVCGNCGYQDCPKCAVCMNPGDWCSKPTQGSELCRQCLVGFAPAGCSPDDSLVCCIAAPLC